MLQCFSNKDLVPILEAYQYICENAEGRNINKAEKYIKTTHPEIIGKTLQNGVVMTPRIFTQEIRNTMPNVRLANCKFLLGVSRIYFEDMASEQSQLQQKANTLNKILLLIASDAHVNEYDSNLNGLSLKQLEDKFSGSVKSNLEDDMALIKQNTYDKNSEYEIVKINSFEEAKQYANYTEWCVTHYQNMFDNYTSSGRGVFYFCLKNGFKDIPAQKGDGCPMDEYGKSMFAISVNDDGSLNTCTCRWNHYNGGNDNMMTTQEISNFFGVNFYEVFKPLDARDIYNAYLADAVEDRFAKRMGWICCKDDDTSYEYVYVTISNDNRLIKYRKVYEKDNLICIAYDKFYWYDIETGRQIPPPPKITTNFECNCWSQLTSIIGTPKHIEGYLCMTDCNNLQSLDGSPQSVSGDIYFDNCNNLKLKEFYKLADKPAVYGFTLFGKNANTIKQESNGVISVLVDFDDIEDVIVDNRDSMEFHTISKILKGEGWDIFSDWDYDFDIAHVDGDVFDEKLKEYGLRFSDIVDIWGDNAEDLIYDGKLSEEQVEKIKELLDNDFYDGNGIYGIHTDCQISGMESQAYAECKDRIFNGDLPISDEYGIQDDKIKLLLTKDDIARCLFNYNPDDDENILVMLLTDEDGDCNKISVQEPYYGWDGFDSDMWDEAMESFADKVIEILNAPKTIKDSPGQMYFDFGD